MLIVCVKMCMSLNEAAGNVALSKIPPNAMHSINTMIWVSYLVIRYLCESPFG